MKRLLLLAALFTISMSGSAFAHVTVKPAEVVTAGYQTFTVSVPNEKDIATTTVSVSIPENISSVTPTVKPGWSINTKKEGDRVQTVTWSEGSIGAGLRDEFTFSAKTPDTETELQWKAYQTYADGTVVSWDKPATENHSHESEPNSGPFSVTKVVSSLPTQAANTTSADTTTADRALYLAGASLLVSFIGIYLATRQQKK